MMTMTDSFQTVSLSEILFNGFLFLFLFSVELLSTVAVPMREITLLSKLLTGAPNALIQAPVSTPGSLE